MEEITIRDAEIDDAKIILNFVRELAKYEKAETQVVATENDIRNTIFGPDSTAYALVCCLRGCPIGFAVYFYNYSTWLGKNGLFLEDLYISPSHRGNGAGKKVLKYLAKLAVEKNCGRFEWNVLDWNAPAIKFYRSIGAKPQTEWIGYRLAGKSLADFAND